MIGHRGAAARAPENTLEGIQSAADAGARWVEVDARLTADDVPVLMHDPTLDRTTDGAGRVRTTPADTIAQLDAGGWFNAGFAGARAPTLEVAADLAGRLGIGLNVELKPDADTIALTGERVGQLLERLLERLLDGMPDATSTPLVAPLLLSCFDAACLRAAKAAAPRLALALNAERATAAAIETARGLGCCALHLAQEHATPAAISAISGAGLVAGVFTVNHPPAARRLLTLGVSYVFTDDPARLASI